MSPITIVNSIKKFTAFSLTAALLLTAPGVCVFANETGSDSMTDENVTSLQDDMSEEVVGEALPDTTDAASDVNETVADPAGVDAKTDIADVAEVSEESVLGEAASEDIVEIQDEQPVGDDDSGMEGEGGTEATLDYDPEAIVSSLSGSVCEPGVFWATPMVFKGENVIKLQWKLRGASYYTLDSYKTDGSYDCLMVRTRKKNFTDSEAFLSVNNLHLYRLRAYDSMGMAMGDYVTVPRPQIMSIAGGTSLGTVTADFVQMGSHYRYVVESAPKKKFDSIQSDMTVYPDDEKTTVSDGAVRGTSRRVKGFSCLGVTDSDASLVNNKTNYYRVQAILDINGLEFKSKPSDVAAVKTAKHEAPIITRISRYMNAAEAEEDELENDLIFNEGNIYVRFENGLPYTVDATDGQFVVYRAGKNGSYRKIITAYIDDLTTALDGNKKVNYVIPYDNFPPDEIYDYKVAVSYKGMGAFSEPFERTCHYSNVDVVTAAEYSYNSVRLVWRSDPCAKKYNIYRSFDTWDSKDDAEYAMTVLTKDDFKKVGTKNNDTPREGVELEYVDRKGLEIGMYHVYRIVPVYKKEAEFTAYCKPMAIKAYPSSPEEVFEYPVNLNTMDIVFSPVSGAKVYKIQRTDTMVNGEPVFSEQTGVEFLEWEYDSNSKALETVKYSSKDDDDDKNDTDKEKDKNKVKIKYGDVVDEFGDPVRNYRYLTVSTGDSDTSVVRGKKYYYRVIAATKVGEAIIWADEDSANWTEAHTQLAPVRDMMGTLYGKSSSDASNVAQISFKPSGRASNMAREGDKWDYEQVDHYDIVTSTTEKGLDNATPMVIDGKTFSYTSVTNGTTNTNNVNLITNYDTKLFKNVRGVKRGKEYYFGVRNVYKEGNEVIYGNWTKRKFILPNEVFFYPEGSSRNTVNSEKQPYEIPSGSSKDFILEFDPFDTTFTDVTVTVTSDEGTVFSKSYNAANVKKDGSHYFTVTAPTVYATSTITPRSHITVTAINYNATGDVKSRLVKTFYVKCKKTTSTTTK